jgi:hypothetical protein
VRARTPDADAHMLQSPAQVGALVGWVEMECVSR